MTKHLSQLYPDGTPMDDGPIVAFPKDVAQGYLCIHPETGEECDGYKPTPEQETAAYEAVEP